MSAKNIPVRQNREQMERDTLRLLCSVLVKPGTRLEICRLLKPDNFSDPLRRTVFEQIREAGAVGSKQLRSLLLTRVALRNVPRFDLKKLFSPELSAKKEISRLFESTVRLLKLGGSDLSHFFYTRSR